MALISLKRKPSVIQSAILKIKSSEELDFIKNTFEEIVSNSMYSVRIDIINGKSYAEEGFEKNKKSIYKFFVEFFDTGFLENITSYLLDANNDFRVTDLDGTIVRPSKEDYDYVVNSKKTKKESKKLIFNQEEDY